MKRILILISAVLASAIFYGSTTPIAAAVDNTPPVGGWSWCSDTLKNGCIEAVTTISPEKVEATYTSASELPSDLFVSAQCSPNGSVNTCDTNRYMTRDDGQCAETPTWGARFTTPSIEFDIKWPGKSGWTIRLRLSTGNFRPAFTIGHGTTAVSITNDGDGTFTYTHTSKMEMSYSVSSGLDWVHNQLWPRDHLLIPQTPYWPPMAGGSSSSSSSSSTSTTSTTVAAAKGCKYYPFESAWAEANATSFSWSYSSGDPFSTVPNVLKFSAQAPHYLPQVSGQPLEVMPARVQVFMPTAYFSALGYASLSEFNSSSYAIATEDGQKTVPTATVQDTGILINLGIQHYSSPNPSVTFVAKGSALNSSTDLPATPEKPKSTVIPVVTVPTVVALPQMVKKSSKNLSSFISYKLSGTKSWKVSGGCTIVGTKLRAPNKRTTCKLTLTVRNSKKKIIATKSQTIKIS